ncbi:cytochrome P450 [Xylariaceae sp. FL0804]|nr:cytochrome P450 [Xylariaceae sp. FL0804]
MSALIPGPWPLPFLGNMRQLDPANSISDMGRLADVYGPIYKLRIFGEDRIVITSRELVNEVCVRPEFAKYPLGFLKQLRNIAPEGLFTAYPNEESWGITHRILMPVFGAVPIQKTLPGMMDIVSQLVLKWARFGSQSAINATQDFTRLTVDTLALCMMDTRFNSFYREEVPPYIKAMVGLLEESQLRVFRPWWYSALFGGKQGQFDENINLVRQVASDVIARRRADPSKKKDLVDSMLNGHDPKTGRTMTDEMIIDNMMNFLIAGHETTAGLLSFLFALLMSTPEAYAKLQSEIDRVLGNGPMKAVHIKDMPYLKACLWETSRLYPSSGVWTVTCMESAHSAPVILGGQWEIQRGQTIYIVNPKLHRDPDVWGDDVHEFKPERMLGENFKKLPKNCLKPFGNGQRACIGR